MNDLEKLATLLPHWKKHNEEHAEAYREWAEKASSLGRRELAKTLLTLSSETKNLSKLFDQAIQQWENS